MSSSMLYCFVFLFFLFFFFFSSRRRHTRLVSDWTSDVCSSDLISDKEVAMATSLIDNLTDSFQPERYTDDYKAAFQQIVDQKMKGLQVVTPVPAEEPRVMDLMAALKASVEATKQGKKPAARAVASKAAKVKVAAKTSAARPAARRRTA